MWGRNKWLWETKWIKRSRRVCMCGERWSLIHGREKSRGTDMGQCCVLCLCYIVCVRYVYVSFSANYPLSLFHYTLFMFGVRLCASVFDCSISVTVEKKRANSNKKREVWEYGTMRTLVYTYKIKIYSGIQPAVCLRTHTHSILVSVILVSSYYIHNDNTPPWKRHGDETKNPLTFYNIYPVVILISMFLYANCVTPWSFTRVYI